jgi:hypothetical protein
LAVGVFIAFWQSHHASVGLAALAVFTILYGLRTLFGAPKNLPIALMAILTAFIAAANMYVDADATFIMLIALWGVAQAAADFLKQDFISASFAAALAALFTLVPLDTVSAVGFFGAYLIVSGVHLGIAAYSPKR